MLTADRLRELLHYDPETGVFTNLVTRGGMYAGDVAGRTNHQGYRQLGIDGRRYSEHRLAWLYMTGAWPPDQIDHLNCDKADNRWCNLREATQSQNLANIGPRVTNSHGFKGATRFSFRSRRFKWQAQITVERKTVYLGLFDTPEAARAAYAAVAKKYFGEFARVA